MRAIITGAPIEIDGEPAEIAQLVELLTSGAVLVEHKHRWRIGELDGSDLVKGSCWCGQERDFNPHLPDGKRPTASLGLDAKAPDRISGENTVAVSRKGSGGKHGGANPCSICGEQGHNRRTCPERVAD